MGDLLIDVTEIEAAKDQATGDLTMNAVLIHAQECLATGGRVIVERRYENAPPDRIAEFTSFESFREYIDASLARDLPESSGESEPDILDHMRNEEPDTTLYTDAETFGADRGAEVDKAFQSGKPKKNS
jgi:hypothetical protein